jgi:hypothetical protein
VVVCTLFSAVGDWSFGGALGAASQIYLFFNAQGSTIHEVRQMQSRRLQPLASIRTPPDAAFRALESLISAPDRRIMKIDDTEFRIRPGKVP